MRKPLLLAALLVLSASFGDVYAVGLKTQLNCASDYYAYCSQFPVGSSGVRKCMKDNGPRLSKACVNALIADGEISKAEVERTKEKIAVAKAKPKREPSKVTQVADAPEKPKQKVVASPDIKPILKREPKPASKTELVIDQSTYEALISRVHFLADPVVVESTTVVQSFEPKGVTADEPGTSGQSVVRSSSPTEPLAYNGPAASSEEATPARNARSPETVRVDFEPTPPVTAKVAPKAAGEHKKPKLPATEKSEIVEAPKQARGSINTTAGKMSLGKNPSADQANRPEPSNSQAWDEYMQSRFNGGMNYEGLGARFSKGR
jgi:hypothetical protein